ncbi:MAG TPA: hypothetical protein VM910_03620 [Bradyrhizobium sp.]|nr:hypothetical protein [Bradyrhizobium sp.]
MFAPMAVKTLNELMHRHALEFASLHGLRNRKSGSLGRFEDASIESVDRHSGVASLRIFT